MFVKAAMAADIFPGGMKATAVGEKQIVICNFDNKFYALERRCGHLSASLDMGTLDGNILTCPLHYAQFDITTGEALSGPVPPDLQHPTRSLITYPVKLEAGAVLIDV
jgi:nitrite reductase/ring-hydroxylating ferredoxin subunit